MLTLRRQSACSQTWRGIYWIVRADYPALHQQQLCTSISCVFACEMALVRWNTWLLYWRTGLYLRDMFNEQLVSHKALSKLD